MNILFVTSSISFGGAAKMLLFVADELSKRNHCVSIFNLKNTNNVTDYERTVPSYINVITAKSKGHFKIISELCQEIKRFRTDVIIGFTAYPSFYGRIAGWLTGVPSIMSERGDPSKTSGGGWKSSVMRWVINRSSGGVFQTDGAKEQFDKGLQKRGIVIPNPIFLPDALPELSPTGREKTVVSVGRLDNYQKRYDVMLKAFKLFSESHPDYILKLYGRGGDEDEIKQWVKDMELEDKVKFMGLTTTPMHDIVNDGMFIITSDFEGISNSLLEAMAVGLPCVSTDHTPGGARLLITDHESGLLAPIQDSEALAKAMCEYAETPELSRFCGENAKLVKERFAPDKIIDAWEEYINQVSKR